MSTRVSDAYRSPLLAAFAASFVLALVDWGELVSATIAAVYVFWGWAIIAIWRRPQAPIVLDLALIRWACFPFVVVFDTTMYWVWHLRGLVP
jgi:hypothetical protein